MKGFLVALVAFVPLVIPVRVFAKVDVSRITISGADLKAPIQITDPKTLSTFHAWSGPGTNSTGNPKQADRFVIDWSQTIPEPPKTFQRYVVSFYAKMPNERLVYVVIYEFDPATEHGCVYLPGKTDEWYRLNVSTIFNGVEGSWFRASETWDYIARPLIVARVTALRAAPTSEGEKQEHQKGALH